jgi:NhaA family Na+:H+ antiporter
VGGVVLLLCTLVAIGFANSSVAEAYEALWEVELGIKLGPQGFDLSVREWINDGLMTIFFFVISLELKRAIVLGDLGEPRVMALPLASALGGMAVPAAIYLLLMAGQDGWHGWGTVMATDTAFVIGCLALFGSAIPNSLRVFLVSLAIFDDVGAIAVVAIAYGDGLAWLPLGGALLAIAASAVLSLLGVRSFGIFAAMAVLAWLGFFWGGIHPTVAGVVLGLMTPARAWVGDQRMRAIVGKMLSQPQGEPPPKGSSARANLKQAHRAIAETLSPLERLEIVLLPWVGFTIMPLFALANAGVAFTSDGFANPVTVAIVAGLAIGKPVGVLSCAWIAVRLGLAKLPDRLGWPFLTAGACLTGIGFTMSLFIARLAYSDAGLGPAKVGIMFGSGISGLLGLILLWQAVRRVAARQRTVPNTR